MDGNGINRDDLKSLLLHLRENGVDEFRGFGVEIKFSHESRLKNPLIDNTSNQTETPPPEKKEEAEDPDLYYSAR